MELREQQGDMGRRAMGKEVRAAGSSEASTEGRQCVGWTWEVLGRRVGFSVGRRGELHIGDQNGEQREGSSRENRDVGAPPWLCRKRAPQKCISSSSRPWDSPPGPVLRGLLAGEARETPHPSVL